MSRIIKNKHKMNSNFTFKVEESDGNHNVTFHTSKGLGFPFQLNFGCQDAEKVHHAHIQIMSFENDLLKWMSASDDNAKLFLQDPFKALEQSKINVPKEIVDNLKNASNLLVNNLKK